MQVFLQVQTVKVLILLCLVAETALANALLLQSVVTQTFLEVIHYLQGMVRRLLLALQGLHRAAAALLAMAQTAALVLRVQ
jgi:hypothetical protein